MIGHTNTEIQIFFEAKAACVSCTFAIHDFHKGVTALSLKNSALIRATADMMEQLLSSDNVYDILLIPQLNLEDLIGTSIVSNRSQLHYRSLVNLSVSA